MGQSQLKLDINNFIEGLGESALLRVSVFLNDLIAEKEADLHWESLTATQKEGILKSYEEIERGSLKVNEEVIAKYRKKFSNE